MSTRKGRVMPARDARTGDTIMPPSAREPRLIQRVRKDGDEIAFDYTDGSHAYMGPDTPLRIYRASRVVNDDVPAIVFQSAS